MARTNLEMVERGWKPCVSGSVVDSSEKENGPAMSNSKEAQENFGFLVSYFHNVLERHVVFCPGS